jgi:endonuclease/exonuclease/phosphatase family metal-dependent hydrolase
MRLRLATWNLENFDARSGSAEPAERIAALRPTLRALAADVLCLQEVGAERVERRGPRALMLLGELLEGTDYAAYEKVAAGLPEGGLSNIHNLVVLSRFPVRRWEHVAHRLVPPPVVHVSSEEAPREVRWDRPILFASLELSPRRALHVLAAHLRAPLATALDGHKLGPFSWRSVTAWAEGFTLSSLKRMGQALEARRLVEELLAEEPEALILAAGDFNADSSEMPLRLLRADLADTGNPELKGHVMTALEGFVPEAKRFTVIHRGRRQVLDHLLASPALAQGHHTTDILNDGLGDEWVAARAGLSPIGSFHAPVVSELDVET